jgi:HEAT repeat protein
MAEYPGWETKPEKPAVSRSIGARGWLVVAGIAAAVSSVGYRYSDPTMVSSFFGQLRSMFDEHPSVGVLRSYTATLDDRIAAAIGLRSLDKEAHVGSAVKALLEALETGEPPLRTAAAQTVGVLANLLDRLEPDPSPTSPPGLRDQVIAALVERLDDPDADTLLAACVALNQFYATPHQPGQPLPPSLVAHLDHEWASVRATVCQTLVHFPADLTSLIPKLISMLDHPDAATCYGASQALVAATPDRAQLPTLLLCLRSDSPLARFHAARLLGKLGPSARSAAPELMALLKEAATAPAASHPVTGKFKLEDNLAEEAAVALARTAPGDATIKFFVEMLEAGNPAYSKTARWSIAATGLENCGPPASVAVPVVISCVERMLDAKPEPRSAIPLVNLIAKQAPGSPSAERAVKLLTRLLASDARAVDPQIRITAARALGHFGRAAEPAIPRLKVVAGEPGGVVRGFAAEALSTIEKAAQPESIH